MYNTSEPTPIAVSRRMFISKPGKTSCPESTKGLCGPSDTTMNKAVIMPKWSVSKRPGSACVEAS